MLVKGLGRARSHVYCSLEEHIAAWAALVVRAVGDIHCIAIPGIRQVVGKIEAIEKDTIDLVGDRKRSDNLLDVKVSYVRIPYIPYWIPAL